MGKSRAEIQRDYRERKKLKEGRQYLDRESERVKKYYKPSAELSRRDLRQRRERNNRNLQRHRDRVKVMSIVTSIHPILFKAALYRKTIQLSSETRRMTSFK